MDEKKSIVLFPTTSSTDNFYLNNLVKMLEEKYEIYSFEKLKNNKKELLKKDIILLNWYENVEKSNFIKTLYAYIKRAIFIFILKIKHTQIIWTVHNRKPHEANYPKLISAFMNYLAFISDKIHILCSATKEEKFLKKYENKIFIAHHGDYIDNYKGKDIDIYERYNIPKEKKIMLFVGQIRKYKNIELLISTFKKSKIEDEDFVLLICGKCNSNEYKEELEKNTENEENIYIDFNFIKEDEMESYLKNSEIIVAPYNKESSLNSGTLWMSLSYGKTMLLPQIGGVADINSKNNFLYIYDYNNENEHSEKLLECFNKLKDDVKNDREILSKKGKLGFEYIKNNQTWEKVKEEWFDMIER